MATNSYPQLIQGTTGWLYDILNEQLETINPELEEAIASKNAPKFTIFVGSQINPETPIISINYGSTVRTRIAQHNYQLDLQFRLIVQIPESGDNSSASFEMARQVCADNLQCLFSDEAKTLTPKINAGIFEISAFSTSFTSIINLNNQRSADGKTFLRGFELPMTFSYTLTSNS